MPLNFPYYETDIRRLKHQNYWFLYTFPLVANRSSLRLTTKLYETIWHCLWRCWKDPGDRSEMDLRNLRRYVHCERICESSTNEAQTSLLVCLRVYFLQGSLRAFYTGPILSAILIRYFIDHKWDCWVPLYQNDPDCFAQLVFPAPFLQGACRRSLDRDSGHLLVAQDGTLTACHLVGGVVSVLPETSACSPMLSFLKFMR